VLPGDGLALLYHCGIAIVSPPHDGFKSARHSIELPTIRDGASYISQDDDDDFIIIIIVVIFDTGNHLIHIYNIEEGLWARTIFFLIIIKKILESGLPLRCLHWAEKGLRFFFSPMSPGKGLGDLFSGEKVARGTVFFNFF
jgi:hypothetical protein